MSDLPSIEFDGIYRVLGCLPNTQKNVYPKLSASFRGAASFPIQEIDFSWFKNRIMNQGATNSCVGHGSIAAMETSYKQAGNVATEFSPYFTYAQINNGYDDGANIIAALKSLENIGAAPLADIPKGAMYKKQMPKQAYEDAARFKLTKAFECESFEDILQALVLGFPVVFGIDVGNNFSSVDANGVPPIRFRSAGGHCMCAVGIKKNPTYGWTIRTQNSWGTNFGINGYCYLTKDHFANNDYGAFAVQSIMDDPLDKDPSDDVPTIKV
jgi:C1A family cysteine protease